MKITTKTYNLNGKISTNIVLISDIHYSSNKDIKHLNKVLEGIKKLNPKYICIPGDFTDRSNIKDEKDLITWFTKLSKISSVIISIGNHEYVVDKKKKLYWLNDKLLSKINKIDNVYLLDNENIVIDNINFIGLNPSVKYYKQKNNIDIRPYFEDIKTYKKYYNILLCHSPVDMCDKKLLRNNDIDLVLCGHMHGGCTPNFLRPILKNRGLINPEKGLFPKLAYGCINLDKSNLIITSGIMVISNINPFRKLKNLFSSEIVNIFIHKN